jgi:hypothetical protein
MQLQKNKPATVCLPTLDPNPAKPEAKSGTLFRQPQLDRETRSQTGHPAFKEYPTRLLGFHRYIYAKNVDNSATVTNGLRWNGTFY